MVIPPNSDRGPDRRDKLIARHVVWRYLTSRAKRPHHQGERLVSLNRVSAPNPECNKIRSRVGERALGGDFITIRSAFSQRGEEGEQSIVSLESGDGFAG